MVKYNTSNFFSFSSDKFQEMIKFGGNEEGGGPVYSDHTHEWISACLHSASVITCCYIQTEVCGETLRQWRASCFQDTPSDECKMSICEGILSALDFIHNRQLVHQDVRPDNIFFASPGFKLPIKIGEFGLSRHQCVRRKRFRY